LIESFEPLAGAKSMDLLLLESGDLGRLGSGIQLIVNATPIGMFPDSEHSPWPQGCPFPKGAAVYDLVYNPRQTRLVRDAQAAGLRAKTGLGMLVEQAALSFACWTGRDVAREILFAAVEA
jgi:shikimate dehydrogenase